MHACQADLHRHHSVGGTEVAEVQCSVCSGGLNDVFIKSEQQVHQSCHHIASLLHRLLCVTWSKLYDLQQARWPGDVNYFGVSPHKVEHLSQVYM
jgi:hypothetical protein